MSEKNVNIYPTSKILQDIKIDAGQIGPRGPIGKTPNLFVENTITGEPDSLASVEITGTPEYPGLTFTIPRGTPFRVEVEYPSVSDLENNTNPTPSGYSPKLFDLAMIVSDVEDSENAKLFIYNEKNDTHNGWSFVSDLSGATGPMRPIRWVPGTSILEWQKNDGLWDSLSRKDLALNTSVDVVGDKLELSIENSDGHITKADLTSKAIFGTGQSATKVKFKNNNDTETRIQELGVYGAFNGTNLELTNPNGEVVNQELALDYEWQDTNLGVKNPNAAIFDYQKLSPDISYTSNNGVSLSIVEPGSPVDFKKISPDIEWSSTKVSITEPGTSPLFRELGVYGQWNNTALEITNPNGSVVVAELGLYGNFNDTEITITNPSGGAVSQELGVYGRWNNTELILENPNGIEIKQELSPDIRWTDTVLGIKNPRSLTFNERKLSPDISYKYEDGYYLSIVEPTKIASYSKIGPDIDWDSTKLSVVDPGGQKDYKELGVYGSFNNTTLTLENPTGGSVTQELGVYADWNVTSLNLTNPDGTVVSQDLGVYSEWLNTELRITNPDGQVLSQELALDFNWNGTILGLKNPTAATYSTRKLSPDISFSTVDGVQISVVEPNSLENFVKISPDLDWDVTKLSVVEPGAVPNYKELGLYANWNNTKLEIENPNGQKVIKDLGLSSSWNNSQITVTNPDGTSNSVELGVYSNFNNTELVLTNPNGNQVSQELALDYSWNETSLGIKNPTATSFDYVKLSPDIDIRTNNGVEISIVEPGVLPSYKKLSPDINWDVTKLSVVEPGATADYKELGLYADWNNTELEITNPNGQKVTKDLGLVASWTNSTLEIENPNGIKIEHDLGVKAVWSGPSKFLFQNPDGTSTNEIDLSIYADFQKIPTEDETILTLTDASGQEIKQQLGVYSRWNDITKLVMENPDTTLEPVELGLHSEFNGTVLKITNPKGDFIEADLGIETFFEDTTLNVIDSKGTVSQSKLGLDFDWNGTSLGIKRENQINFSYVNLKGDTGDPYVDGANLFKIRGQYDNEGEGFDIRYAKEIQFTGGDGVSINRNSSTYSVEVNVIDGGEF